MKKQTLSDKSVIVILTEIDHKLDYLITMIREDDLKYPHHSQYLDETITGSRDLPDTTHNKN